LTVISLTVFLVGLFTKCLFRSFAIWTSLLAV